jgi:hypothetical protein
LFLGWQGGENYMSNIRLRVDKTFYLTA